MEVQTTNYDKTDSEILEIARGKAEKSEELKKLGKTVNVDGEISTEEDGQTVPPYFDVIVDNDMYKVSMEEQEFIGEVGKIVPSVDFSATTTSKSITLKITTKRSQGGTVDGTVIDKKTWTNKEVKVTAKTKIDIAGYTLVTKKNNGAWQETDNQTFSENGIMYVALTDGRNYGTSIQNNYDTLYTTDYPTGNIPQSDMDKYNAWNYDL